MSETILFVDDDPNILAALPRALRGKFDVQTALGPEQGLAAVRARGPYAGYAVAVADMQMPGMTGVEFLERLAEQSPTTIRIMLTGQADQQTAIDAVNKGNIFRFLTKPCPTELLASTLAAGLTQYRLVTAERELLAKTLSGSIKLLTDVLAMVKPKAFGKAARVRRLVQQLASQVRLDGGWQLEIAAMLSQIGCVTMPDAVLERIYQGKQLTAMELEMFQAHPRLGSDLVANIPRLEGVAQIIASQQLRFDGIDTPAGGAVEAAIPMERGVLKLALDFDALTAAGKTNEQASFEIRRRRGWYDPVLVDALASALDIEVSYEATSVAVTDLTDHMVLDEHVLSSTGDVLITRGQEVTATLRQRLINYGQSVRPVKEPIRVLVAVQPQGRQKEDGRRQKDLVPGA